MADADEQAVRAMMEQQRSVRVVEEKIASLETRTTVIEVKQGQFDIALAKLADVMAIQANKTTLNEAAILAIEKRTDDHNKHIEELQKTQLEHGHQLIDQNGKLTVIWRTVATIATTVGLIVIEYIFTRILPK